MSKWSKEADWETFLTKTIKTGSLPGNKVAEKCGIPFGAWLEMANKANRIGKEATIKWARESLEKIQAKVPEELSAKRDAELSEKYTIVTNLGWSGSAYYIVNGENADEVLRWGEKALTFTSREEAERFAAEVFPGENGKNYIEHIENWENEGGHIDADNLSYKDGHLKEKTSTPETYAKNIAWDTDGAPSSELGLPDRILIPPAIAKEGEEAISDYITQETGFCHYGFEIENVPKERDIHKNKAKPAAIRL